MSQLNKINVNGTEYTIGGSGGGFDLVIGVTITNMSLADSPEVISGSLYNFWSKFMTFEEPVTVAILDDETYMDAHHNQCITNVVIRQNDYNLGLPGENVICIEFYNAFENQEVIYIFPNSGSEPTSDSDMNISYIAPGY